MIEPEKQKPPKITHPNLAIPLSDRLNVLRESESLDLSTIPPNSFIAVADINGNTYTFHKLSAHDGDVWKIVEDNGNEEPQEIEVEMMGACASPTGGALELSEPRFRKGSWFSARRQLRFKSGDDENLPHTENLRLLVPLSEYPPADSLPPERVETQLECKGMVKGDNGELQWSVSAEQIIGPIGIVSVIGEDGIEPAL